MKRIKEVSGMKALRMAGVLMLLVVMVGANGWGQGSKVKAGSTTEAVGAESNDASVSSSGGSTVFDGAKRGRHIRAHRRADAADQRRAMKVEFVDESGSVTGGLEQGGKVEGREIDYLLPTNDGRFVASLELTGNAGPGQDVFVVRYLNSQGKEVWRAGLCCDIGGSRQRVVVSDDGSVVALIDAGEGGECLQGESTYPAPPGCVGLRIFTAEGREIFRTEQADEVNISPKGKYAIFVTGGYKEYYQLHVASGKAVRLPKPEGTRIGRIPNDDGVVWYGIRKKIGPPVYKYIPGKGLEKVKVRD